MFRDLKEYQDIAKIYADKVSKPENLEERRGSSPEQLAANRKDAFKGVPNSASNKRAEMSKKRRGDKKFEFKKLGPQGAQGRTKRPGVKKEPEYKPEKGVVFGQRTNEIGAQGGGKPSEGNFKKDFPDKKPEVKKPKMGSPDSKYIKKDKGVGFVKRGTPMAQRAENKEKNKMRAQEMAKKRIADKKAGNASTPMSGREKAQAMAKARIAAKKSTMEEYTPYDFVLEYLLSTEQVATIEEANYVMTEMDGETIQGIVETQKKTLIEKPDDGYIGPKFLGIKNPMNKARKDYQMDYKLKKLSGTGDSPETRDMLNIPRDYEITPEQKKKYGL